MTLLLQIIYIQNQHINFMFKCVVFINITANQTIQGYYNQVNSPKLIILVYDKITRHFITERRVNVKTILKIRKVQVGKDQEKAQSEKDSHSKNRGGKKPN